MQFDLEKPKYLSLSESERGGSALRAVAPMPGLLDKLLVAKGDVIKQDDPLFVMVAMKMEYIVRAHTDGKIADILYTVGSNVPKDAVVVKFEENV